MLSLPCWQMSKLGTEGGSVKDSRSRTCSHPCLCSVLLTVMLWRRGRPILLALLGFQVLCGMSLSAGCLPVSPPGCPMRSRHWPYPHLQILPWTSAFSCFRFWNDLPVVLVKRPQQSSVWCHSVTYEPSRTILRTLRNLDVPFLTNRWLADRLSCGYTMFSHLCAC